MGKSTVELGEFERRQGGNEVCEFALEHQRKKIAANSAASRQSVFGSKHDLRCKTGNFAVNGRTDHGRDIFMLGDKGSRYDNVKTGLCSTLGNPLAGSVDFSAPHERACSAIRARAWRARSLRCFRNTAPSLASVLRRRWVSAYWRNAVRTSAARLWRRADVSLSSSSSFEVASSMAILFMRRIIAAVCDYAQGLGAPVWPTN